MIDIEKTLENLKKADTLNQLRKDTGEMISIIGKNSNEIKIGVAGFPMPVYLTKESHEEIRKHVLSVLQKQYGNFNETVINLLTPIKETQENVNFEMHKNNH